MRRVIADGHTCFDTWTRVADPATPLTELGGDVVVPLALWLRERDALRQHRGSVGVWLAAGEDVEALAADLQRVAVIDLQIPAFADGRHLSSAVLLRTRLGFAGDLRAFGEFGRDQLSYMRRCGINVFCLDETADAADLMAGLHVMTSYYQGDVEDGRPAFRRGRVAPAAVALQRRA